jgi:hypothetical protein
MPEEENMGQSSNAIENQFDLFDLNAGQDQNGANGGQGEAQEFDFLDQNAF